MELSEAIKIINYEVYDRCVTKEEEVEAQRVFWRDLFKVDIQNSDGSYKSVYSIFEEASKCFNK
jgi:hypothetical protein